MKITDKLVMLFNARLRDLKFEIDTVGYLQNIEEDEELLKDYNKIDLTKDPKEQFVLEYELDEDGETIGEGNISYENMTMFTIKKIVNDMNSQTSKDIMKMVSSRIGINIDSLEDMVTLYENTANDMKHVLQADMVKNYLVSKGLDERSVINIDFVKEDVLLSLMKVLGISQEEL